MPAKSVTAGSIWKTLSKINVNEFTEEKGGLTYLSWSHAYRIMMENYPEMTIKWHGTTDDNGVTRDVTYYEGGTASVSCSVIIGDVKREMWLPVMDYRMKSIAHPSSRDISDAKMRCLTKCFSLHGLANYIYSGDGLPAEEEVVAPKPKAKQKPKAKAKPKAEPAPEIEISGTTLTLEVEPETNGVVDVEEIAAELKAACAAAHKAGWEPDEETKESVKAALGSRNEKKMLSLLSGIKEVSAAAFQLNDDREQGDLLDA